MRRASDEARDKEQRRRVGPLEVVEGQDRRAAVAAARYGFGQRVHERGSVLALAQTARPLGVQQLVSGGAVGVRSRRVEPECLDDRCERQIGLELAARAVKRSQTTAGRHTEDLGDEPALADPRLALDRHHSAAAVLEAVECSPKHFEF